MNSLQIEINEPHLLTEIQKIFQTENISTNEAVMLFFRWVKHEKRLPHDLAMFNQTTQKAITDSYENSEVVKCKDVNDFFEKIGI